MNNNNNDRNRFESTRFLATRDALHQANDWFGGSRAQQTATAQAQRCCCISPNLVCLSVCLSVGGDYLVRLFLLSVHLLWLCAPCHAQGNLCENQATPGHTFWRLCARPVNNSNNSKKKWNCKSLCIDLFIMQQNYWKRSFHSWEWEQEHSRRRVAQEKN